MKYILFTGHHCKNCVPMKHNMDKANIKYDVVDTDTDKGKMLSGLFRVSCLPFLAITKGGKPLDTFPGLLPVAKLVEIKAKYK